MWRIPTTADEWEETYHQAVLELNDELAAVEDALLETQHRLEDAEDREYRLAVDVQVLSGQVADRNTENQRLAKLLEDERELTRQQQEFIDNLGWRRFGREFTPHG